MAHAVDPSCRVQELFRAAFSVAPEVVASAPGRVNLIGEHVDYADGCVLPVAIEQRTAVALGRSPGQSRFVSEQCERAWSGSLGRTSNGEAGVQRVERGADRWANYILGPLAEVSKLTGDASEWYCAVASDVPLGAGVSSSAALEVATMWAGLARLGHPREPRAIALRCQYAEHHVAGTPCGIMDMMIASHAIAEHAMLLDCRSLQVTHVPLPASVALLVIDSGVRHRLSDGGYASRREAVERAAAALGVAALRDATMAMIDRSTLDSVTRQRARHVVTEIERTERAAAALVAGDVASFGALMDASHQSLRDDFEVSIPEIDEIVAFARAAPGTYGARLTGGGFGGSVVALVERARANEVSTHVNACFAARFGRELSVVQTKASAGARTEELSRSCD